MIPDRSGTSKPELIPPLAGLPGCSRQADLPVRAVSTAYTDPEQIQRIGRCNNDPDRAVDQDPEEAECQDHGRKDRNDIVMDQSPGIYECAQEVGPRISQPAVQRRPIILVVSQSRAELHQPHV